MVMVIDSISGLRIMPPHLLLMCHMFSRQQQQQHAALFCAAWASAGVSALEHRSVPSQPSSPSLPVPARSFLCMTHTHSESADCPRG